jgi:hypothetical protein
MNPREEALAGHYAFYSSYEDADEKYKLKSELEEKRDLIVNHSIELHGIE